MLPPVIVAPRRVRDLAARDQLFVVDDRDGFDRLGHAIGLALECGCVHCGRCELRVHVVLGHVCVHRLDRLELHPLTDLVVDPGHDVGALSRACRGGDGVGEVRLVDQVDGHVRILLGVRVVDRLLGVEVGALVAVPDGDRAAAVQGLGRGVAGAAPARGCHDGDEREQREPRRFTPSRPGHQVFPPLNQANLPPSSAPNGTRSRGGSKSV